MRKHLVPLALLVGFFAFLALPLAELQAYSIATLSLTATPYQRSYPDDQTIIHTATGRYVYAYESWDGSYIIFHLELYDGSGTHLASESWTSAGKTASGTWNSSLTLTLLNATSIIMFGNFATSAYDEHFVAIHFNVVSYTVHAYDSIIVNFGASVTRVTDLFSQVFDYSGYKYMVGIREWSNPYVCKLQNIKYNTVTHAFTVTESSSLGAYSTVGFIRGVQSTTSLNLVYVMFSYDDITRPHYYEVNLATSAFSELATHPNPDRWGANQYIKYLRGEVLYNATTSRDYLYFTWAYPYVNSNWRKFIVVQDIMEFNTTITQANLLAQQENAAVMETGYTSGQSIPSWVIGRSPTKTDIYIWYADSDLGADVESYVQYRIDNFYDINAGRIITQVQNNLHVLGSAGIWPFWGPTDVWSKRFTEQFQTNVVGSTAYIISGLTAIDVSYDLSLVYTPVDVPLYIDKAYKYTATGTVNFGGFEHYQLWYLDNHQIAGFKTTATGIGTISYTVSSVGVHNFTIAMYTVTYPTLLYSESFTMAFVVSPTSGTAGAVPGVVIVNWVSIIAYGIPALFCIFIPTIALAKIKGVPPIVGMTVGLTIGIIIATVANIIPIYLTFFGLLGIAILLIFMTRGRGD